MSEAALAESEARFRAVADNIPRLAWMAEPDRQRVWYDRRWHDYTHLPEAGEAMIYAGISRIMLRRFAA